MLLLTIVGLVTATQAQAPESPQATTRQELLRLARERKRNEVRPPEQSQVEKQFLKLDKAETPTIADWNWNGFYPRVAWPSRGSGAALGVRYWEPDFLGPVDAAGAAFYSWRGYQHYDVQFGLMPHIGRQIPGRSWKGDDVYELGDRRPRMGNIPLYATFRYRYLPEEDFYGIGPDASLENRTSYLQKETRFYLRTGVQLGRNVALGATGGLQWNELDSGRSTRYPSIETLFDDTEAPRLDDAPDYVRYGGQVFVDLRDEPGNPHRGLMVGASLERFDDREDGPGDFERFGIDVRGFLPLGSRQRVLALRSAVNIDRPETGARVPFFMQQSLGGSHTLRGFDSFRFRGEKLLLMQAEYRWEPVAFWELLVFSDAGTVSQATSELDLSTLEWDYGFGTRFKSYRDVVIRLEIAFSRETTRYYVRGSSSF
ncbi:MAG TPA: BamA/TamA family outer membrane protein [Vicinamibacteria bacterium]|nr:BamA/TamA family outer membrane protein [Vicinamibacteria bacterium]